MGVDAVVAALMSEAAAGVSEAGKPVAGVPKLDINKGTAGGCMPLAAGVREPLKLTKVSWVGWGRLRLDRDWSSHVG